MPGVIALNGQGFAARFGEVRECRGSHDLPRTFVAGRGSADDDGWARAGPLAAAGCAVAGFAARFGEVHGGHGSHDLPQTSRPAESARWSVTVTGVSGIEVRAARTDD